MKEKLKKYRCNLLNRCTLERQTLFFYAESDRDAQNRLILFLQMLLGMSVEAIEKITVGYDPDNANTVNAAIQTDDKPIPVFTGVVILETDYQASPKPEKKDALVDALQKLENAPVV